MMKYQRLTKETLRKVYEICHLEHEALLELAESGETIFENRIDFLIRQYEGYFRLVKQYSVVRRRKKRRDSKKHELTDSSRKAR